MYGSRLATAARRLPPPAPATTDNEITETRDPVTSPPLPVPDRIARGRASPKSRPQLFCAAARVGFGLFCVVPPPQIVVCPKYHSTPPSPSKPPLTLTSHTAKPP